MAEFLFRKTNHWTRDANELTLSAKQVEDKEKTHQIGDIVEVYEDGRCTEKPAPNSIYYIVKVPGLKKAEYNYLTNSQVHYVDGGIEIGGQIPVIDKRRRYGIQIDLLPSLLREELLKERWIEIKAEDFLKYAFDYKEQITEANN